MNTKKTAFRLALVALGAVCLAGCGKEEKPQEELALLAPVEAVVDIETVIYRDLYTVTSREAEYAPYTRELSFDAGGSISKLYVEVGSVVKEGDLLAEQEEEGVRSAASDALNKYMSEKKAYLDAVKTAKKKLATKLTAEERAWQELLIEQAEELWTLQEPELWEAWENARARVGKSEIFAPFDGVVTACIAEGTTVAAGQPVMALGDSHRSFITLNSFMEQDRFLGYEKVYGIVNGKETPLQYRTELMEEESNYTYFSAEDMGDAKIGDFVLICMVDNFHGQVLSIPNNAVYKDISGNYVYLIQDGIRVRQPVTTGYKSDVYTEILEGLQEGDRVYVKR